MVCKMCTVLVGSLSVVISSTSVSAATFSQTQQGTYANILPIYPNSRGFFFSNESVRFQVKGVLNYEVDNLGNPEETYPELITLTTSSASEDRFRVDFRTLDSSSSEGVNRTIAANTKENRFLAIDPQQTVNIGELKADSYETAFVLSVGNIDFADIGGFASTGNTVSFNVREVPEPSTMFSSLALGLGIIMRRHYLKKSIKAK